MFTLQVIRFLSISYGILGYSLCFHGSLLRPNAYESVCENAYGCGSVLMAMMMTTVALVAVIGRARRRERRFTST